MKIFFWVPVHLTLAADNQCFRPESVAGHPRWSACLHVDEDVVKSESAGCEIELTVSTGVLSSEQSAASFGNPATLADIIGSCPIDTDMTLPGVSYEQTSGAPRPEYVCFHEGVQFGTIRFSDRGDPSEPLGVCSQLLFRWRLLKDAQLVSQMDPRNLFNQFKVGVEKEEDCTDVFTELARRPRLLDCKHKVRAETQLCKSVFELPNKTTRVNLSDGLSDPEKTDWAMALGSCPLYMDKPLKNVSASQIKLLRRNSGMEPLRLRIACTESGTHFATLELGVQMIPGASVWKKRPMLGRPNKASAFLSPKSIHDQEVWYSIRKANGMCGRLYQRWLLVEKLTRENPSQFTQELNDVRGQTNKEHVTDFSDHEVA